MPIIGPGSGGGGGGLSQLFDSTLGAGATSIDSGAAGFATTFNVLYIYAVVRGANAGIGSQGAGFRFNNDSGNNYWLQTANIVNATYGGAGPAAGTNGFRFTIADAGNSANFATYSCLVIPNYGATVFAKGGFVWSGSSDKGGAINTRADWLYGIWDSTAAISRVSVFSTTADNLLTGSRLTILAS